MVNAIVLVQISHRKKVLLNITYSSHIQLDKFCVHHMFFLFLWTTLWSKGYKWYLMNRELSYLHCGTIRLLSWIELQICTTSEKQLWKWKWKWWVPLTLFPGFNSSSSSSRYAMKCLDKKRIKMKSGETLALNERIMLSLVSEVRQSSHRLNDRRALLQILSNRVNTFLFCLSVDNRLHHPIMRMKFVD